MSALNRPEEEADWQQFGSMKQVAWKTGTSYGGRDAWAIGTTPRYTVGVWVGNASGEGRPGLTGVGNAAPVLFDLFSLLPGSGWFDMPYDELLPMAICRLSGHKASAICDRVDTLYMPRSADKTEVCPYHRLVPSFCGRPFPGEQLVRIGRPDDRTPVVRTASFRRILLPELSYRLRSPASCQTGMRRRQGAGRSN